MLAWAFASALLTASGLIWAGWLPKRRRTWAWVVLVVAALSVSVLTFTWGLTRRMFVNGVLEFISGKDISFFRTAWLGSAAVVVGLVTAAYILATHGRERRVIVFTLLMSALPCVILLSGLVQPGKNTSISRLHDIKTPDL